MRRLLIALAVLSVAVLAIKPASADSFYIGYSSGYRHGPPPPRFYGPPRYYGPRHYGPRFYGPPRYGYRYGHHRYGYDYGRYAAGGLILGLALGSVLNAPSTQTVQTRSVERVPAAEPSAPVAQTESLPALGYRLARDGTCWLLEDGGDGRTIATEQPPTACAR